MVMAGYGVVARHHDRGRLRGGQRLPDPALHAAQLAGLRLSRDQAMRWSNMEKMFGLLDVQAEIADKPGAPALEVAGGEIVFDHVDFHYEKARPILHDVSFRVPPGDTVAIVGSSGAGKSTISRILFRFYDVAARQRPDRRPGHPRRHAVEPAGGDRRGAAGHRAVQRHDLLQHRLRPARRHAARRSRRRRGWRASTTSSWPCRTATTRRSASAA